MYLFITIPITSSKLSLFSKINLITVDVIFLLSYLRSIVKTQFLKNINNKHIYVSTKLRYAASQTQICGTKKNYHREYVNRQWMQTNYLYRQSIGNSGTNVSHTHQLMRSLPRKHIKCRPFYAVSIIISILVGDICLLARTFSVWQSFWRGISYLLIWDLGCPILNLKHKSLSNFPFLSFQIIILFINGKHMYENVSIRQNYPRHPRFNFRSPMKTSILDILTLGLLQYGRVCLLKR